MLLCSAKCTRYRTTSCQPKLSARSETHLYFRSCSDRSGGSSSQYAKANATASCSSGSPSFHARRSKDSNSISHRTYDRGRLSRKRQSSFAVCAPICEVTAAHQVSLASVAPNSVETCARRLVKNRGESATKESNSERTRFGIRSTCASGGSNEYA